MTFSISAPRGTRPGCSYVGRAMNRLSPAGAQLPHSCAIKAMQRAFGSDLRVGMRRPVGLVSPPPLIQRSTWVPSASSACSFARGAGPSPAGSRSARACHCPGATADLRQTLVQLGESRDGSASATFVDHDCFEMPNDTHHGWPVPARRLDYIPCLCYACLSPLHSRILHHDRTAHPPPRKSAARRPQRARPARR